MKSSSWPATTESSDTFNSEKPTSVISPTDLPPVKLSPSQEYPQRKSSSNSSSSVSSIPMEYHHGEEYSGPTSPNPGIYTAKPYYIEDSTPDMDSWFNKDKDHNQRYSYSKDQNPPSPPTRDIDPQRAPVNANRRERRTTKDSLTGAYQSYLEEMLQQEECLKDVAPSEQAPPSGHSSTAHSPDPLSQTAPSQLGLQQRRQPIMEERLNRTAALSQEAVVPLTVNTSSANQWTEERNKKNNLMGQMNERTWQSPDDFKKKSDGIDQVPEVQQPPAPPPVDEKEEEWKRFAQKADSEWESRQQKKDDPQSLTHKRELSEIDEKSLTENAPRMRSPINKMLVEAVGSKEDITGKSFSRMMEENGVSTKKESRDVRKSNEYAKDSENPFRNSDKPKLTADTFSSEDWKKISEMESGNSIMSQLRNSHQTPFSAKYVNGEPVIPKKERNALAEQKPSSKSLTSSAEHSPQTVRKESSKPPELPPRSQAASEAFYHPKLKDSGHYRSESYDLDLRTNNKVGFPAKRADVPSESNSTSNHTRAHSFTSGYYPPAPYGVVPSEPPRCTSIPEEQTSDAADVPPPLPPRNIDRRSSDVVRSIGSTEELSKARSDRERRVSDPRQPESVRRSSSSRHSDPRMYWAQHQYSKSDSEKYQRVSSSDSWHKMSDPSGAIRKSHKVSDPDEKRKVQEALRKFYHEKTSSQDSGVGGSRPSSICDYGDHYSSMSSIPSTRPGSVPADTLSQYHRQSVFSSQTSLSSTSSICRDSGISSPNPANWAQHSPPQIANIPSPEYDRHHPPMRYSTSALPDTHHGQYDHRNPPWLSNELQQGRKSTPVTRSSSMSVKLDQRRSYEGNVGLSRTDSFTAYKTRPESANADSHRARSGSDGQQEKRKRRSREERKSREEMHSREERIRLPSEKTVEELPIRKWTPPKQSPLTFSTKDQTEPPLSETQTQVQQAEANPSPQLTKRSSSL
ncbi:uncharacterized protein [Amphiura filiformis]|uniref:uncharacterized protein n=1 Tax=Amphiura filiformis TaxID=82378 RepID=UPI003B21F52F